MSSYARPPQPFGTHRRSPCSRTPPAQRPRWSAPTSPPAPASTLAFPTPTRTRFPLPVLPRLIPQTCPQSRQFQHPLPTDTRIPDATQNMSTRNIHPPRRPALPKPHTAPPDNSRHGCCGNHLIPNPLLPSHAPNPINHAAPVSRPNQTNYPRPGTPSTHPSDRCRPSMNKTGETMTAHADVGGPPRRVRSRTPATMGGRQGQQAPQTGEQEKIKRSKR